MTDNDNLEVGTESISATSNRVGLYSAILTALTALVTFSFAIIAIPNSGAGCRENCFEYPYANTLSEFPRDYLWMPSAMLLVVVYVILMVSIHMYAAQHKKVYSQIGLSFALIAAGILLSDYYIQFSCSPHQPDKPRDGRYRIAHPVQRPWGIHRAGRAGLSAYEPFLPVPGACVRQRRSLGISR
jgi:hypothetical protein